VLGDNSPNSEDGRWWGQPTVASRAGNRHGPALCPLLPGGEGTVRLLAEWFRVSLARASQELVDREQQSECGVPPAARDHLASVDTERRPDAVHLWRLAGECRAPARAIGGQVTRGTSSASQRMAWSAGVCLGSRRHRNSQ